MKNARIAGATLITISLGFVAVFSYLASRFGYPEVLAGLARWPTLNYTLAQRFIEAGAAEQQTIATVFDAGNLLLGTVIGEFIGEISLSLWFLTLSVALVRGVGTWQWPGYVGLFTAASMTVGAFRNLTHAVDPVAALNNTLLPLWLITLGVTLMAEPSVSLATDRPRTALNRSRRP